MSDCPDIQSKSKWHLREGGATGFEEGEPVGVTWPAYETPDDNDGEVIRADAQTILGEFIRIMTSDATALQVGQRMIVLAFLAGKLEVETECKLAKVLKVSPGRVSQIKQQIPNEFQSLCNLQARAAKAQDIDEDNTF
jgi:hypothetical protein